jgi:prepilin-type processing-associated H-X9-DG protein
MDPASNPCVINCSNASGVYGFHNGGANFVFVDGSVHFLTTALDPNVFFGLVTINGGELISGIN